MRTPDARMIHLRPSERDLFHTFEDRDYLPNAIFTFDVHLGAGMPLDPAWPPWLSNMATALTQRRVDVIAATPKELWILEIKDRVGTTAIGQLLLYQALYIRDIDPTANPRLGLICPLVGFDLGDIFEQFAITVFPI
jgi:hypothetical protein